MENQGLRNAVSNLVSILRKITRIVQIVPFVYLLFYGIYMLSESFLSEPALCFLDELLYVPTAATAGLLFASRLLKLCIWHKTACLIPMSSKIETYIDCRIFQFTENEIILINTIIGVIALLFIIRSYRHFFYGRKRTSESYA